MNLIWDENAIDYNMRCSTLGRNFETYHGTRLPVQQIIYHVNLQRFSLNDSGSRQMSMLEYILYVFNAELSFDYQSRS